MLLCPHIIIIIKYEVHANSKCFQCGSSFSVLSASWPARSTGRVNRRVVRTCHTSPRARLGTCTRRLGWRGPRNQISYPRYKKVPPFQKKKHQYIRALAKLSYPLALFQPHAHHLVYLELHISVLEPCTFATIAPTLPFLPHVYVSWT